jgi:BRCT domain type II-containing protein
MRSRDVRRLPCRDHLKEVIYRCLGARAKRYQAARDLITALRHRPRELATGRIRSLRGRRVSFTGFLRRHRREAIAAARRAGAVVQSSPGPSTDVLVRGRPNALQVAGKAGGRKLMEIRRLAARGHHIIIIGEAQFWRLAHVGVDRAAGSAVAEPLPVPRHLAPHRIPCGEGIIKTVYHMCCI